MTRATDGVGRAEAILEAFAERTGLTSDAEPRRYLWTDAFAVCAFLSLFRRSRSTWWLGRARSLVDQVHHVLGRHRHDDARDGWISGLDEDTGERHPTAGGLRIGKPLPERPPGEPLHDRLEWERDGQYYHYLTRWMHALERLAAETGESEPARWGVELAKAAHRGFAHREAGQARLYWKASIDLSRPLVPSMGQHDPLDGLTTTLRLQARLARAFGTASPPPEMDLESERTELAAMCRGRGWATTDALGIGGLLVDGWLLALLDDAAAGSLEDLMARVLVDADRSMDLLAVGHRISGPAEHRLAFRELGLAIGLAAVDRLRELDQTRSLPVAAATAIESLVRHTPLRQQVAEFWLDPAHQAATTWTEHEDINAVMLAASLVPDGYLATG
jgi:hypothetical protein